MAPKVNRRSALASSEELPLCVRLETAARILEALFGECPLDGAPHLSPHVAAKLSELLTAAGFKATPCEPSREASGRRIRSEAPPIMSRTEVARLLRVSVRNLQNLEARNVIPVIKIGRRRLYRRAAVLAALKSLES